MQGTQICSLVGKLDPTCCSSDPVWRQNKCIKKKINEINLIMFLLCRIPPVAPYHLHNDIRRHHVAFRTSCHVAEGSFPLLLSCSLSTPAKLNQCLCLSRDSFTQTFSYPNCLSWYFDPFNSIFKF